MAVSQNQRLRKAAAKAAKRKAVVAEKKTQERRDISISRPRHIDFATSPIHKCLINRSAFASGTVTIIVARTLPLGRFGVASFLVDLLCRGVKDAFFRVMPARDFDNAFSGLNARDPLEPIEPSAARKLVHGAVEYAASIGLPPTPAYADIEPIFGDTPLADERFTYGKNGKPLYLPGPSDTPRVVKRVLKTLSDKLGADGFDYVVPLGSHDDDFDDQNDHDDQGEVIEGKVADDKAA
jgi:hypothetical protein